MPVGAKGRGPRNRKQVSLNDPHELRAWAQHFKVSVSALIAAVLKKGTQPDEVAHYLEV